MFKKRLAILLASLLVVSTAPTVVFASENEGSKTPVAAAATEPTTDWRDNPYDTGHCIVSNPIIDPDWTGATNPDGSPSVPVTEPSETDWRDNPYDTGHCIVDNPIIDPDWTGVTNPDGSPRYPETEPTEGGTNNCVVTDPIMTEPLTNPDGTPYTEPQKETMYTTSPQEVTTAPFTTAPSEPATDTRVWLDGFYVVGSGLPGVSWETAGINYSSYPKYMKKIGNAYYQDFMNVPAGEITFKVVYCEGIDKVTWHPDGMGNDSKAEVAVDGSTVRIILVPTGDNTKDAAYAEVYAPGETVPEMTPPTEPVTSTEPVTQTEPPTTEPVTQPVTQPVKLSSASKTLSAGATYDLFAKIKNASAAQLKKVRFVSDKKTVAAVSADGKVTALKKGTANLTVKIAGKNLKFTVKVKDSPTAKIKKKVLTSAFYTVKKGKTLTVALTGKAKEIANVYSSTKYAKVISAKKATSVKIKGLKKGTTKVKITVNKVKTFTINIKVT